MKSETISIFSDCFLNLDPGYEDPSILMRDLAKISSVLSYIISGKEYSDPGDFVVEHSLIILPTTISLSLYFKCSLE